MITKTDFFVSFVEVKVVSMRTGHNVKGLLSRV